MSNLPIVGTQTKKGVGIVFLDIVGYSSMAAHFGDLHSATLVERFLGRAQRAVEAHEGSIKKVWGDGFLAIFDRTVDAVAFAIEFQKSLRDRPITVDSGDLQVRIAVHWGTVLIQKAEYGLEIVGMGVSFAARLEAYCPPGNVILSQSAHLALPGDWAARFIQSPPVEVKGAGRVPVWLLS